VETFIVSNTNAAALVVDDDPLLRAALGRLLRSVGLDVQLFASVDEFQKFDRADRPSCLVLDVRLPGRSGLDFQRDLAAANIGLPIVFITGHGDIPMTVQAMKHGAVEFLTKPFREQDLLDAIHTGLARDRGRLEDERVVRNLRECFETLSPREREIMIQIVQGRVNKQIASDLGVTETTVKVHRCNMMRKMNAASLLDLRDKAEKLKLLRRTVPTS